MSVPDRVMDNNYFASLVDTNDEWIVKRTGIKERRWVEDGQNCSDLALEASRKALDDAGIKAEDLDLIVVGTLTADYLMPSCAVLVQSGLGAKNAAAFDVASACTGFLTALSTAEAFVASGRAKRVLAIGAETLSRYLNKEDRSSCILFGDGAGAAVITSREEAGQGEILGSWLGSDGDGFDFITIPTGGAKTPHNHPDYEKDKHFITLRGRDVYRFAVTKMTEMIRTATEGYDSDEVGLLVPHQVNMRIIESALERLGWSEERCMLNIDRYGNTSAASVPIALAEAKAQGRLEKGKLVVLVAFGAGLTWGATLIRW
ncbi:MAG: 3-oxoacyl-[acyl-carrier-protein] synthase-3 [Planctomycetota bacterium]|jgi:3-oxoacyl-[acyl-carrier-protein] synthase-3